jgi:NADH:ubiquinone oxidoreductase subunit 2 (subunit N)
VICSVAYVFIGINETKLATILSYLTVSQGNNIIAPLIIPQLETEYAGLWEIISYSLHIFFILSIFILVKYYTGKDIESLSDLRNLSGNFSYMLILCIFSIIGIPIFGGFYIK